MKKNILFFILGLIIAGSIGVYATIKVQSSEIGYKDGTVEDALNDLYQAPTVKKICKLEDGYTANTIGSKYKCKVNDKNEYYFYILKINGNSVKLIMDRNITGDVSNITWNDAMKYINTNNLRTTWSNVLDVDLPMAQDIADAIGYNVIVTDQYMDVRICVNDLTTGNCTQTTTGKNAWLYNYTNSCASYGCNPETSLSSDANSGYWTRDLYYSKTWAYCVNNTGAFFNNVSSYPANGVRPVITVLKSSLYE